MSYISSSCIKHGAALRCRAAKKEVLWGVCGNAAAAAAKRSSPTPLSSIPVRNGAETCFPAETCFTAETYFTAEAYFTTETYFTAKICLTAKTCNTAETYFTAETGFAAEACFSSAVNMWFIRQNVGYSYLIARGKESVYTFQV
eukprot:1155836-Pelagomonas_calceolata.AAC.5